MNIITHAELAQLIGTFDYEDKFTPSVIKLATTNGLVIVTAIGDDVIKFHGSIRDEADCMRGGDVFLQREGDEVVVYKKQCPERKRIKLQGIWEKHRTYTWKFRTLLPHSKFKMNKGGKSWCECIIFSIKDIGL